MVLLIHHVAIRAPTMQPPFMTLCGLGRKAGIDMLLARY